VDLLDLQEGHLETRPLSQLLDTVQDLPMAQMGEIDRAASTRAEQIGLPGPVWRLTFRPLVQFSSFIQRLSSLLSTLEAGYQHPVDVEFTLHIDEQGEPSFNLVQCRPLATIGETGPVTLPEHLPAEREIFRTQGHFMGGNINLAITRIIRIDAAIYANLNINQRYDVARRVGEVVRESSASTLLIGPGRWGTSSPELGVPVRFADIAGVSALVEVSENAGDMVPDLSYGSHFFQDLVETGIAYVALFPESDQCRYRPDLMPGEISQPDNASDIERAVRVYVTDQTPLQLTGDVVRQELVCYRPFDPKQ
jgi:hypothetical protein